MDTKCLASLFHINTSTHKKLNVDRNKRITSYKIIFSTLDLKQLRHIASQFVLPKKLVNSIAHSDPDRKRKLAYF